MCASGRVTVSFFARVRSIAWLCLAMPLIAPFSAAAAGPAHLLVAATAVGQSETGTIKGRLVWGDEKLPEVKELVAKGQPDAKDTAVCAKSAIMSRDLVVDPKTKGVTYAFAYLVKPKGDSTAQVKALLAKTPTVELDQKNCEFQPFVLAFHKDQKLVIKSSDPVGHNVRFAGFSNTGVNTMVAPNGKFEIKLDAEKRPMELRCDIHTWMTGYLLVLDHPFFATTATDGSFEIKDVPAGSQNLVVWQKKVGFANAGYGIGMPVTVKAGEVTDVGEIKVDPVRAAK
jgi:hypothetical protein